MKDGQIAVENEFLVLMILSLKTQIKIWLLLINWFQSLSNWNEIILNISKNLVKWSVASLLFFIPTNNELNINDIIFLSFFLGNDYVECFKENDECQNAFDIIIDSYWQMNSSKSLPNRYLTDGSSFIIVNLKCFISYLITKLKNW